MRWFVRVCVALVLSLPAWLFADELVVVTRVGCPPCAKLKVDLLRRPELYAGHSLKLLEGREAMAHWGVELVPTLIRIRDGREIARRVGYGKTSDLTDWLKQHD